VSSSIHIERYISIQFHTENSSPTVKIYFKQYKSISMSMEMTV